MVDQNDAMGMKQLLEIFMMNNPAAFMNLTNRDQNELPPEMSMMLNAIAKQSKVQMEVEPPETRIPRPTEGHSNVFSNPIPDHLILFSQFKPLLKRASTHVALAYYIYSKTVTENYHDNSYNNQNSWKKITQTLK